ncbi:MAG: hypothetical protein L3J11_05235 [Draconibacterium sp.]|nr:hypothetical protein [Draconibacterium sp.]
MKRNNNNNLEQQEKITRKDAIKKVGVTALTTATMLFLSTKASASDSVTKPENPGLGRDVR